ncbi:MAG: molybdenum cofactor guanylyltransferase [Candidatus Aminicenantes bacterium]|nr:molybdenum cofactor guanylyltransferase [Candidatus Aminicenantes bacterium]
MNKHYNVGAIILAGGKATRMNGDKALLPVSGVKLIEKVARNLEPYFGEILISARSKEMFDFLPYPVVGDERPGCGPLMGILSALRVSGNPINFVIACDIPEVNIDFLEKMTAFIDSYDIVVPTSGENKFEPLFAFYSKKLIPIIEDLLNQGIRKINRLYPKCRTKYVPFDNDGWYHNLNTMADYLDYLKKP